MFGELWLLVPTLLKFAPPSVLFCHCTPGCGLPETCTVKLAFDPLTTVALEGDGWDVICGAKGPVVTLSVTALLAVCPAASLTCTRYMPESVNAALAIE